MLISNHVLAGTLLGRGIERALRQRPLRTRLAVAAGLGLASHYACDSVPHWGLGRRVPINDPAFLAVAVPDGLVGLGLLTAAVTRTPRVARPVVAVAALAACLPDADKPGRLLLGRSPFPPRHDAFHGRIQRESPGRWPLEVALIATQAAVVLTRR